MYTKYTQEQIDQQMLNMWEGWLKTQAEKQEMVKQMLIIIIFAVAAYALFGFEIYMLRKQRADLRAILRNTGHGVGTNDPDRRSHAGTDMGAE